MSPLFCVVSRRVGWVHQNICGPHGHLIYFPISCYMIKDYWLRSESLKAARMVLHTIIESGGGALMAKLKTG
ncbi:hypothetical protein FOXYSP1_10992 [Fusarium oxysporum f. sp. phaseoli]